MKIKKNDKPKPVDGTSDTWVPKLHELKSSPTITTEIWQYEKFHALYDPMLSAMSDVIRKNGNSAAIPC